MASYRIILANHHPPLREGLKRILKEKPDLKVVGETGDSLELFNLLTLSKSPPHLVILDLSLPNLKSDVIYKLKAIQPEVKVITLSMHKDKEYFGRAIINGADGYLLKEDVDRELLPAISTIREGGVYLPSPLEGGGEMNFRLKEEPNFRGRGSSGERRKGISRPYSNPRRKEER